jgi:hypothetical protein
MSTLSKPQGNDTHQQEGTRYLSPPTVFAPPLPLFRTQQGFAVTRHLFHGPPLPGLDSLLPHLKRQVGGTVQASVLASVPLRSQELNATMFRSFSNTDSVYTTKHTLAAMYTKFGGGRIRTEMFQKRR